MKATISDLGISYDIPKEVIEELAREQRKQFEDKTDSDFKEVIEKLKAM